eukprot:scaffold19260_cov66-Phaeocystis_antarctica.AAC.1
MAVQVTIPGLGHAASLLRRASDEQSAGAPAPALHFLLESYIFLAVLTYLSFSHCVAPSEYCR